MEDVELREMDGGIKTQQQLPPVDRGRDTFCFLASSTILETLVWGFPFSVGVLHLYWTDTLFPNVADSASTLAITGTLLVNCIFFSGEDDSTDAWNA